ncbi:MAG: hypothetical protein R2810_00015 [Flavobacteriales bacterium]|nr:hypothetical protein [Flavobacteriales bacterium]MCB0787756.1 hypothetical protein [Flavobacteriales bacterium]MCB0809841.1 hypothetical protein [Flavobacteriales bacterium]MCB0816490.1 hypothetical protein [Flavobacteriales bacterium]MCB9181676.1 ABC transporter ATPase [Flavobacteriales bacterium]
MTTAPSPTRQLADLPAHARVWVYKSARPLGQAEQKFVREQGSVFCDSWAAHGAALDAAVDVLHDRFVVIAVDEVQAKASGCSIDKSVGFIKDLEYQLNLMLTDRMVVVFELNGELRSCRLEEVQELLADGTLSGDTIVYDDLVTTKADLDARFQVPLRDSWMARYL